MSSMRLVNDKSLVAVYGDEDGVLVNALTRLLPPDRTGVQSIRSIEELENAAPQAVLMFIRINNALDPNRHLGTLLSQSKKVVCAIIAVTSDLDITQRMRIMACGFDAIFNLQSFAEPDMKTILHYKLEKGFSRLQHRTGQEEYQRFRASLSASPDAFIVFDENLKLFFVSEHYKRAYPNQRADLVRGLDVGDAFDMLWQEYGPYINEATYEDLKAFWENLEGEREVKVGEDKVWRIRAAKLAEGLGTIVTTTDITNYVRQQKLLEEKSAELAAALEKEQEAGLVQKQFIDMVSHEFRTPLTIIDGNTQLLINRYDQFTEDKFKGKLGIIRSAVSRLVTMLEGVLSSSMLQTGKFTLSPVSLNLKQMVGDIVREHEDLSGSYTFNTYIDDAPEEVALDKKTVLLVMSNLLSNAIKFSPDQPEIDVTCADEGEFVKISVRDHGIGIPENEIENVLKRYVRSTTASGIPGTGIGLDLVKSLVDMHEGRIEIQSKIGKGTTVEVHLKKL